MRHHLAPYRYIFFAAAIFALLPAGVSEVLAAGSSRNQAPVISGSPPTSATVGQSYDFQPAARDANGDRLSFGIANKPTWASFSTRTGRLSGTPGSRHVRTYSNIVVSVSDGRATARLAPFSITVSSAAANRAPTISGTPATAVTAGSAYDFRPTASDADSDTLVYSIVNKPTWAAFSTSTGRLSGTPASRHVGSYTGIRISVSDGEVSTSLPTFGITVNAVPTTANRAPTISGTPTTAVTAGSAYAFQPAAGDADGDTLVFSIANKPAWATFNTGTGRLSGTPTASNVGSYTNITIRVSDGTVTSSLPAFGITVNAAAAATTGSASLSWVAPTTRVDGSPLSLSQIAGYRVYRGTSSGNLTLLRDLNDGSLTSYTATGLAAATTHYFAVTVYDSNGNESGYSAVVSKRIP